MRFNYPYRNVPCRVAHDGGGVTGPASGCQHELNRKDYRIGVPKRPARAGACITACEGVGPRLTGCRLGFAIKRQCYQQCRGEKNDACLRLHCAHEGSSGRGASIAGGGGGGGGVGAAAGALPFRRGSGRLWTVRQAEGAGPSSMGGSSGAGGGGGGGPGGGGPMSSSGRNWSGEKVSVGVD